MPDASIASRKRVALAEFKALSKLKSYKFEGTTRLVNAWTTPLEAKISGIVTLTPLIVREEAVFTIKTVKLLATVTVLFPIGIFAE